MNKSLTEYAESLQGLFGRDQTVPWGGVKVCVIPPTLQTVRAACEHLRVDMLYFSTVWDGGAQASLRELARAFCKVAAPERLAPVLETVCAPLAQAPHVLATELEQKQWSRIQAMLREDESARTEFLYASLSMVRDLPRLGLSLGVSEFRSWLRGSERFDLDDDTARSLPGDLARDRGPFPLEVLAGELAQRLTVDGIEGGATFDEVLRYPYESVLWFADLFPELNPRAAAEELQRRLGLPLKPMPLNGPAGPTYTEH